MTEEQANQIYLMKVHSELAVAQLLANQIVHDISAATTLFRVSDEQMPERLRLIFENTVKLMQKIEAVRHGRV